MRILSTLLLSCMLTLFTCNVQKATADELLVYGEMSQHINAFLQSGHTDFDIERYKQSKDSYLLVHFAITWIWNIEQEYDVATPEIVVCKDTNCKHGAYMASGRSVQGTLKSVLGYELDTLANFDPAPLANMPAYYYDGTNYHFNKPILLTDDVFVQSIDEIKIENDKAYLQGTIATGWEPSKKVGTFEATATTGKDPRVLSFKSNYTKP